MTARGAALGFAARRTVFRQTLVPACAILACVLVAAHAPAGVRAPVVIAFLCAAPGAALVGLLRPDSVELELALALALSVALSGLTALVLVYAHLWSPTAVVLIVAGVSLGGGLRDVGRDRARHVATWPVGLVRTALPAAAQVARRAAGGLTAILASVSRLARRVEGRRRIGVALAVAGEVPRQADRRLRRVAAVRAPHAAAEDARPRGDAAPAAPQSSLQSFLLEELRRSAHAQGRRRSRRPGSLAELQPHELDDLLSWSALQRFVTHRAVQQIEPELWFVDDLERRLGKTSEVPRGVWITGVSEGASVPVAWRVLEQDRKAKEWRTRLALEAIDALPGLRTGGAVVAAGTAHGSLSGFRRGLEERGLSYLLRVDAVTAARELAPDGSTRAAAEAREVVRRRLAEGRAIPVEARPNGARRKSELVLVQAPERLVLCEVPAGGEVSAFWLSNLPAGTAPERLAHLVRIADRDRVDPAAHDLLSGALGARLERGTELQEQLGVVALAQGLRTLGLSGMAAEGAVEA